MAKLNDNFSFAGRVGNLSVYRMRGVDKPVVRTRGGASREKIKTSPSFERTRENNAEWGGCTKAGSHIRAALFPVRHLADYNISGPMNGMAKAIQKLDTLNPRGQRSILISEHRHAFEGFSLNKMLRFDTVIRQPLAYAISRDGVNAWVQFPSLVTGLNFYPPAGRPSLFRVIVALGVVPDMKFTSLGYRPVNPDMQLYGCYAATNWAPTTKGTSAQLLELNLNAGVNLDPSGSLMLSVGFELGAPEADNNVTPIRHTGYAKLLALA